MSIDVHVFYSHEGLHGSGRFNHLLSEQLTRRIQNAHLRVHVNKKRPADIRSFLPVFEDLPEDYGVLHDDVIIVQNSDTKKFWVIDFQDPAHILRAVGGHDLFAGGTATMYSQDWIQENVEKFWLVNAGFYFPMYPNQVNEAFEKLCDVDPVDDRLFFAGTIGDEGGGYSYTNGNGEPRRKAARILQQKYPDRTHILDRTEKFDRQQWYTVAKAHKVCLALAGHPHCNREHELYALGVPVLMPELLNPVGVKLVPNKHYIAAAGDDRFYYGASRDQEKLADDIWQVFQRVIDQPEYLKYIGQQARSFYRRNIHPPAAAMRYLELINFEALK